MLKSNGFTLLELMISTSILSILSMIIIPSFNPFIVDMRVNSEIYQLHRLLLLARNTAINLNQNVTVCPLDSQLKCNTSWHKEISVFLDVNNNKVYEPDLGERLLKVKGEIHQDDKLQYGLGRYRLVYAPTGRTIFWGGNGTFKYCPMNYQEKSRGIIVSTSGRVYTTFDKDKDGIDENRRGSEMKCRVDN